MTLEGDSTGDHLEATGILPALPLSPLCSLTINLSTMGWCQWRYREISLVAREQVSNKAPADMLGDFAATSLSASNKPSPLLRVSGHLSPRTIKPGPLPAPDIPGSSLVPSKTSLPGQRGIFQALLLWRWLCCYNPTCLDNQVGRGSGGKPGWGTGAGMWLLCSPCLEQEPKGSNRSFCDWFLSESSPWLQMPSKRHKKLELEKVY